MSGYKQGRWIIRSAGVISESVDLPRGVNTLSRARFDPVGFIGKAETKMWDRVSQLAVAAAILAVEGMQLDGASSGVVIGTEWGNVDSINRFFARVATRGPRFASAMQFAQAGYGVAAGMVAGELGIKGYHLTINGGKAAGIWAVVQSVWAIRDGRINLAVCGGVEGMSSVRSTVEGECKEGVALLVVSEGPGDCLGEIRGVGIGVDPDRSLKAALVDSEPITIEEHVIVERGLCGATDAVLMLLRKLGGKGAIAVTGYEGKGTCATVIVS